MLFSILDLISQNLELFLFLIGGKMSFCVSIFIET